MLCEIAAEVHDPLLKSARIWTAERNSRDGQIRDSLRTRGEVKIILDGLVKLVEQGIGSNGGSGVQEVIDWSLNTLATWARESVTFCGSRPLNRETLTGLHLPAWVDINASVTQESLGLYRKLVEHPTARYRSAALNVYAILLHKGARTSADKLQIVQVLDVMSFVVPLEKSTRLSGRTAADLDDDEISFRASLGKVLAAYGTETLKMSEDVSSLLHEIGIVIAAKEKLHGRKRPTPPYALRRKRCAMKLYLCYSNLWRTTITTYMTRFHHYFQISCEL